MKPVKNNDSCIYFTDDMATLYIIALGEDWFVLSINENLWQKETQ